MPIKQNLKVIKIGKASIRIDPETAESLKKCKIKFKEANELPDNMTISNEFIFHIVFSKYIKEHHFSRKKTKKAIEENWFFLNLLGLVIDLGIHNKLIMKRINELRSLIKEQKFKN